MSDSYIKPMLAYAPHQLSTRALAVYENALAHGDMVAEEKFDGHRMLCRAGVGIEVWSRDLKPCLQKLNEALAKELAGLPSGVYDGELVLGGAAQSSDVSLLENRSKLRYVVFDLLELRGVSLLETPQVVRRSHLESFLPAEESGAAVFYSWSEPLLRGEAQIDELYERVVERGGEGLMLKDKTASYQPGKRSRNWLKIKPEEEAVFRFMDFVPGLMGPRSTARLADAEGVEIVVKWKNHEWLRQAEAEGDTWTGRQVCILYTQRTPSGSYRHPRWKEWL